MSSNGAAMARITVDRALENDRVCWCGDYRHIHAVHGEKPHHVHHRIRWLVEM